MYTTADSQREYSVPIADGFEFEDYRTPWRRDYARLIHSPSFRRLQGKTQLYPGLESDFFRNRLTHSLEVAQIAKSLAIRINNKFKDNKGKLVYVEPDICEFAGLAHDLGHPPFGHQGEDALDECMRNYGGFEGNAQTLRILTKVEKKYALDTYATGSEFRYGLALTYRSLASILKYNVVIPIKSTDRAKGNEEKPVKGFYKSEENIVETIKKNITGKKFTGNFKTIECQIMDIADDIAYSTYDLEDGLKAGFFNPIDWLVAKDGIHVKVATKVSKAIGKPFTEQDVKDTIAIIFKSIFEIKVDLTAKDLKILSNEEFKDLALFFSTEYQYRANQLVNDGYSRNELTSKLIGEFIRGIEFKYDNKQPALSTAFLSEEIKKKVEVLKNYTFESQIQSPRLKVAEFRGKEIVRTIFDVLSHDNGWRLMPQDYQKLFHFFTKKPEKLRTICDFIAGMTDKYAIEFYGRLKSENPETIFKPF